MGALFSKEFEKDNYSRFGHGIVGTATGILRDVLESYVPHTDLLNVYNNTPVTPRLDARQRQLVMNAATDGYTDFDITLLYTLLRNICSNLRNPATPDLPAPSRGWGKDPLPTDVTLSDDIERIRLLRNGVFAHLPRARLSENVYKQHWGNLKDVCSRCTLNTRLQQFAKDYEQELKDLEKYSLQEKDAKDLLDRVSDMKGEYNDVICSASINDMNDIQFNLIYGEVCSRPGQVFEILL